RTALAEARHEEPTEHIHSHLDRFLASVLPDWLEKAAQESEMRVALLFAVVGLGVGLGSILAGYLSGHPIELELVPLRARVSVPCSVRPGVLRDAPALFVATMFGIGCGAGFYLVPLYTQLQHRAPKESKGNVVSASNFLNVVGGIVAVAVFYAMTFAFERMLGPTLHKEAALSNAALLPGLIAQLERRRSTPRLLFLSTSFMTFTALVALTRRLPDFYLRTAIWVRDWGHNTLRTIGIERMPTDGPVLLLTNSSKFSAV